MEKNKKTSDVIDIRDRVGAIDAEIEETPDLAPPERLTIQAHPELVQAYVQGAQKDAKLSQDMSALAGQYVHNQKEIARKEAELETFHATDREINRRLRESHELRLEIANEMKDVVRRLEDEAKLDRNKQWGLDLERGVFIESVGQ